MFAAFTWNLNGDSNCNTQSFWSWRYFVPSLCLTSHIHHIPLFRSLFSLPLLRSRNSKFIPSESRHTSSRLVAVRSQLILLIWQQIKSHTHSESRAMRYIPSRTQESTAMSCFAHPKTLQQRTRITFYLTQLCVLFFFLLLKCFFGCFLALAYFDGCRYRFPHIDTYICLKALHCIILCQMASIAATSTDT